MPNTQNPLPSLATIDQFIANLPEDYRFLAMYIKITGAEPEALLALEAPQLEAFWQTNGVEGSTEGFAQIPGDADVPHMLLVYVRGWREKYIKRNKLQESDRPLQAFLDNKARPITIAIAEKVFLRTAKRLGVPFPIMPSTIRDVAISQQNGSII